MGGNALQGPKIFGNTNSDADDAPVDQFADKFYSGLGNIGSTVSNLGSSLYNTTGRAAQGIINTGENTSSWLINKADQGVGSVSRGLGLSNGGKMRRHRMNHRGGFGLSDVTKAISTTGTNAINTTGTVATSLGNSASSILSQTKSTLGLKGGRRTRRHNKSKGGRKPKSHKRRGGSRRRKSHRS